MNVYVTRILWYIGLFQVMAQPLELTVQPLPPPYIWCALTRLEYMLIMTFEWTLNACKLYFKPLETLKNDHI